MQLSEFSNWNEVFFRGEFNLAGNSRNRDDASLLLVAALELGTRMPPTTMPSCYGTPHIAGKRSVRFGLSVAQL